MIAGYFNSKIFRMYSESIFLRFDFMEFSNSCWFKVTCFLIETINIYFFSFNFFSNIFYSYFFSISQTDKGPLGNTFIKNKQTYFF